MGRLYYGESRIVVEFDDRTLAHLQIIIRDKLLHSSGFFLTWTDDTSVGTGHSSIWLERSIPLRFHFSSARPQQINREWLHQLMLSANKLEGMRLVAEPGITNNAPRPLSHVR